MMMLSGKKMATAVLAVTLAMSLSACSNWSKRDRNTTLGTLGGAAVGGIVGHQVGK